MKFEWDDNKQKINIQKHGVDFYEAQSVFYDEDALLILGSGSFQFGRKICIARLKRQDQIAYCMPLLS